ncbi:MAG: YHS domain-containing protein [Thermodesulfobacteriota bacterium]|nr:YHS domain-containing protein [Thermodesulfobacteriota bacterium]
MEQSEISNQIFIDPICLMKVAPDKKDLRFSYQTRTYYFSAKSCLKNFEADPEKYLESMSIKRKGWWSCYLDRLNRVTGGKLQKCH